MKKVLALALALVMVLGLAVSAFAANVIVLDEPAAESKDNPKVMKTLYFDIGGADEDVYLAVGGTYFFKIDDYANLKNVKVEATGCVTAEIVSYDPEAYIDPNYDEYVIKKVESGKTYFAGPDDWVSNKADAKVLSYEEATAECDAKTDAETGRAKYFVVAKESIKLVKVVVEDNYTAAYKTGSVKVTATKNKKAVEASFDVVADVAIFGYEDVKDAAKYDLVLDGTYAGYSDYFTYKKGYKTSDLSEVLWEGINPVVVSTTAFRAIEGEDLTYADGDVEVTIKNVAAGQKGVNFTFSGLTFKNAKGKETTKNDVATIEFGFEGKQVIASDFDITLTTNSSWFELRERFGKKLEEEDIITYYVLKDGKLYDKVTVDYKDLDDPDEDIELTINGKAGDTLGQYTVQLTAPAAEEGEENPNTGAESMVSVVAALAVVAVASAAAVSLKK